MNEGNKLAKHFTNHYQINNKTQLKNLVYSQALSWPWQWWTKITDCSSTQCPTNKRLHNRRNSKAIQAPTWNHWTFWPRPLHVPPRYAIPREIKKSQIPNPLPRTFLTQPRKKIERNRQIHQTFQRTDHFRKNPRKPIMPKIHNLNLIQTRQSIRQMTHQWIETHIKHLHFREKPNSFWNTTR